MSPPKRIKPRPLVPSTFIRTTPSQAGGGRARENLVKLARESIAKGSKSFAAASMLFDKRTRERVHLLYAWCRRCDDIADGQEFGGTLKPEEEAAQDRIAAWSLPSAASPRRWPTT
jgi:phytoene synthase